MVLNGKAGSIPHFDTHVTEMIALEKTIEKRCLHLCMNSPFETGSLLAVLQNWTQTTINNQSELAGHYRLIIN